MRVLVVAETLGNAYGQERVNSHSCEYLAKQGWDLSFLCAKTTTPLPQCLQIPGLFSFHSLSPRKRVNKALLAIRDFLKQSPPDLVHFTDVPDAKVTRLLSRVPSVATAHTVAPTCPASHRMIPGGVCQQKSGWSCLWHHRRYHCLDFLKTDLHRMHAIHGYLAKRGVQRRRHLMLAPSRFILDVLQRDGFEADRLRLVYNPVVVPPNPQLPPTSPTPLFVAAHRLVPLKGLGETLRALKALESLPWELKVCGEGPEQASLQQLTQHLGLGERVQFLGRLEREEALNLMAQAWGVIQSNLGPESFGMSLAEASALGVPVFGYDLPALDEIVDPGVSGVLVPPRQVNELVEALRRCIEDRPWARGLGQAGRKRVERLFSLQAHGEALEQAYQDCLDL